MAYLVRFLASEAQKAALSATGSVTNWLEQWELGFDIPLMTNTYCREGKGGGGAHRGVQC